MNVSQHFNDTENYFERGLCLSENIRLGRFLESDELPYGTPGVVNDDSNIYQADSSLLNHVVVDPKCQVFPNSTVYCIPAVSI